MPRRNIQHRLLVPSATTLTLVEETYALLDFDHLVLPDWTPLLQHLTVAYALDRPGYIEAVGERLHRPPRLTSLKYTRRLSTLAGALDADPVGTVKQVLEKLLVVRAQLGTRLFVNALAHPRAVQTLTTALSAFVHASWDPCTSEYKDRDKARQTYVGYARALASEPHLAAVERRVAA
jgi:hypothetical protein